MSNVLYYQSKLEDILLTFLTSQRKSKKTIVNYKSDIHHFLDWLHEVFSKLEIKSKSEAELLNQIQTATINAYVRHQLKSQTPHSTINRRLSALRMFFQICITSGYIHSDPTKFISNISHRKPKTKPIGIIGEFEAELISEGASKSTVKNYSTDVENFINWITAGTQEN